jgi:hypothetical protein
MKDAVTDAFSQEHLSVDRAGGVAAANKFAREQLKRWNSPGIRSCIVSGKDVISRLSAWSKRKYNVSFSPETIASEMVRDEIPLELTECVTAIHDGEHFA